MPLDKNKAINWNRQLNIRIAADIAILGGGIAGVCAACAMTGQAAGIAAALSIKPGIGIKALDPLLVRREVENSGAKL